MAIRFQVGLPGPFVWTRGSNPPRSAQASARRGYALAVFLVVGTIGAAIIVYPVVAWILGSLVLVTLAAFLIIAATARKSEAAPESSPEGRADRIKARAKARAASLPTERDGYSVQAPTVARPDDIKAAPGPRDYSLGE